MKLFIDVDVKVRVFFIDILRLKDRQEILLSTLIGELARTPADKRAVIDLIASQVVPLLLGGRETVAAELKARGLSIKVGLKA
jgi:hypothetical protein